MDQPVQARRAEDDAGMAQAAAARRAAEKAALERLAGPLIGAVGELGVAVAEQQAAAGEVTAAEERAREHVRRAQQEADRMLADAHARVATADDGYRQAQEAAVTAGWSPAALTEMGYASPARTRQRRVLRGTKSATGQGDDSTPRESQVA
jgi:hypothetical protein